MNQFRTVFISICFLLSLSLAGCSSSGICEDILEVKRQEQVCSQLSRVMTDNRYPQQALTARKRYETECLNLRYYRDEYDTICKGDEKPIGQRQDDPGDN